MALTNVSSGATKVSRVLTAANQEVTIWCEGQAKVGISVRDVTGTVVITFYGSLDGLTFTPLAVGAYPSATPPATNVLTTAAAGSWEVPVQNYKFIRAQMTTGSGPATVILTASVDGSYQEAFAVQVGQSLGTIYPSTSSSSGLNSMVIPAQAGRTIKLTFLEVSQAGPGAGANAQLRIWDGAVDARAPLYSCYLTTPVGSVGRCDEINLPKDAQNNRGLEGTPGNAMTVQVVNLGNVTAILNARVSYM